MPTWHGNAGPPPPLPVVVRPSSYDSSTSRLLASTEEVRRGGATPLFRPPPAAAADLLVRSEALRVGLGGGGAIPSLSAPFYFGGPLGGARSAPSGYSPPRVPPPPPPTSGSPSRDGTAAGTVAGQLEKLSWSSTSAEEALLAMRRGDERIDVAPPPPSAAPSAEGTAKATGDRGEGERKGGSSSVVVERSPATEEPKTTMTNPRGKRKASESTPEEDGAGAGGVASKASGRRKWKKPKGKPKRPLSAYNLFFQSERARILRQTPSTKSPAADDPSKAKPRRRKHRRTHGKIGFADLARSIAERWKQLDDTSREEFEELAVVEKGRYKTELAAWNELRRVTQEDAEESLADAAESEVTIARHQAGGSLRSDPAFPESSSAAPPTSFDGIRLPPWNVPDMQRLAARQTYLALREHMLGGFVVGNNGTPDGALPPHLCVTPSVPANPSSRIADRNQNFQSGPQLLMPMTDHHRETSRSAPTTSSNDETRRTEPTTTSNLEAEIR